MAREPRKKPAQTSRKASKAARSKAAGSHAGKAGAAGVSTKRVATKSARPSARPTARSRSKSKRGKSGGSPSPRQATASWGVLVYLAGDIDNGAEAIRHDLEEILAAGGSADLKIVVQHDGPDGGARYLLSSEHGKSAATGLGRVDSGSTATLLEFLRWGLSVCQCERLALVLGSPLVVSPADPTPDRQNVFSLSYDQGSGNYMDVSGVASAIREALGDARRSRLDLLAIDSCHVQFLELAYELGDIVHIVIAPQTAVPMNGWDYVKVLGRWKKLAAAAPPIPMPELARQLTGEIMECYRRESKHCAVSALDLGRLDEVARAFDTLCIGTLQALGEGLIWKTRELLRDQFDGLPLYDCGSFFAIWEASLEAMADEGYQAWLAMTLKRATRSNLDRFCDVVSRQLEVIMAANNVDARRLTLVIDALHASPRQDGGEDKDGRRLTMREAAAARLLDEISAGVQRRLALIEPGASADDREREGVAAHAREGALQKAIAQAFHLLPAERQFDLKRLDESVQTARRLKGQSLEAAKALFGESPESPGMVIAFESEPKVTEGWPRWSGVSMYRPNQLDDLMNSSYQEFAFHRHVHWAALLGAANLIEQHPRALWRLVSSLLATGAAGTRRDVLRRLTGADSVIWGLRDQFRVMAPAPTVTLSLERRRTHRRPTRTAAPAPGAAAAAAAPAAGAAGLAPTEETTRENYLLRLESVSRGAVVIEQESRVQPAVMDEALDELNALLQAAAMTTRSLDDLRSIGGLLGEDILQTLGRTLEEEREMVRAEAADATPHLQLQIPRELMKYPWELLHHHGEWLGERYAIGRQVFMETGRARRVPARRQGRVRPLIIGDPIFDPKLPWRQLPGARDEAEQVAGLFEQLHRELGSVIDFKRERDSFIHKRVTRARMRALIRDGGYDIIHFAGHGVFRADDPETSAWLMSDGELWSLEIRNTLAEHQAPPWLVFANACEAGMDAARPERKYQGSVFGLATAFINHGVAAYIAPLWPIADLLAQRIAKEFYRQLLCERATLGEALRRAKADARRLLYPDRAAPPPEVEVMYEGLGWASLVLYGDPTEELFQALAGGSSDELIVAGVPLRLPKSESYARQPGTDRRHATTKPQAGFRPFDGNGTSPAAGSITLSPGLHAADHVVAQWVRGPGWETVSTEASGEVVSTLTNGGATRGAALATQTVPEDHVMLELVEDSGYRRWRVRRPDAKGAVGMRGGDAGAESLPGSRLAALLVDERVQQKLPGRRGMIRVLGRWVVSGFKDGLGGLAKEYDREQVKNEGLLMLNGTTSRQLAPVSRASAGAVNKSAPNRALVIIHGTFSETASPVDGFGPQFIRWARDQYRVVLGLDHWTLSRTPQENAQLLADELRAFDPELLKDGRLDIISHSRGGLVGRAFCELEGHGDAVRNLIFLGTPNCGTDLANPKNWGSLADVLVNMTGVDGAELFGRLAGLLAQLAVAGAVSGVPGLLAQSPESALDKDSFLHKLQNADVDRKRIRYSVICAEFEPTALVPNLSQLAKTAGEAGIDGAMDALFATANDLVVNTRHAWGIASSPADVAKRLPKFLPPNRVLVYGPSKLDFDPPAQVLCEPALGVHHCNLFSQARAQDLIKAWLTEA